MEKLKPVEDQVVVITGASSGIGRDAALRFGERGARVVLAARDIAALEDVADEIRSRGGQALPVQTDVTDYAEVQRLAGRAAEVYGGIDTWINDAAVAAYGTFEQMDLRDLRQQIDVNFWGQVHGARAALPYLKRRGSGAIIFIGSAASDRAIPLQSGYCAAKHAMKALTESLRTELQHEGSGVQVTLVKPASINTPFFDEALTLTGYRPRPVDPVYDVSVVSDVLLHCAEHRERDISAGGGSKLLSTVETFAGPIVDAWFARTGFKGQMTDDGKSAESPNNLYEPLTGDRAVRGPHPERKFSLYTSMRLRGNAPLLALGAAGTAFALLRTRRDRRERSRAA
jgi:NAD(P)-dependent dehydrogenase (short-subunit alcohol dehydrogenase family)